MIFREDHLVLLNELLDLINSKVDDFESGKYSLDLIEEPKQIIA